jgi:hypothetical protein
MDDRLAKLRHLEAVTLASIEAADPEKRAPLIGQMRAILGEIEKLASASEGAGDPVDEIAARRTARGGATARLGQAQGR